LTAIVIGIELISRLDHPRIRRCSVIALSILFLGWLDFWSLLLLICLSTTIFAMIKARLEISQIIYPLSLSLIGLLLAIKDLPSLAGLQRVYIPLGVSYYFFRLISFLIEYSKDPENISQTHAIDFFSWVFFFPVFLAGPILRFNEMGEIDKKLHHQRKPMFYRNLAIAVFLKILVVDLILFNLSYVTLQGAMELRLSSGVANQAAFVNFVFLFAFSFSAFIHAYLDLMLYTEISKAMAGILGFTNVDNFDRPLLATNISVFWQKWHMSLSNWTRDYIFFPMLIKTRRTWPSTYASMLILGIWHAATLNWVVWAIAHATAINLYGEWRKSRPFRTLSGTRSGSLVLKVTGNISTIGFVGLVFIFVAVPDFWHAINLLAKCL
jgi:alginate O-acetyltransferase complex protein AlgI